MKKIAQELWHREMLAIDLPKKPPKPKNPSMWDDPEPGEPVIQTPRKPSMWEDDIDEIRDPQKRPGKRWVDPWEKEYPDPNVPQEEVVETPEEAAPKGPKTFPKRHQNWEDDWEREPTDLENNPLMDIIKKIREERKKDKKE